MGCAVILKSLMGCEIVATWFCFADIFWSVPY